MRTKARQAILSLTILLLWAGCAQPPASTQPPRQEPPSTGPAGQASPPRGTLKIAWGPEPTSLAPKLGAVGFTSFSELAMTFNSALARIDPQGQPHPQLAKTLPELGTGSWVVNADGSMETTYALRENAKWHDGMPLTAHDYVFAYEVYATPEIPVAKRSPENLMAGVQARDDHTLVVRWREPYYAAGSLRYQMLDPLPRHLLEERSRRDKATFLEEPFWTAQYIGSGPFRLERWEPGSGLTARAFLDWAPGPPRAATIDIRFIGDGNTILANLLSGEVDISGQPWLSPSVAASVKDRWVGEGLGVLITTVSRLEFMDFQFREVPRWTPAIRAVPFRQAMHHALDRESLTDVMNMRLGGSAAHAFIQPTDPVYADVDRVLAKYPYDPARATALLGEAGFHRPGADALMADNAGQPLQFEMWRSPGPDAETEILPLIGNLKEIGIDASPFIYPAARSRDNEFLASYPGGVLGNRVITPDFILWTSSNAATPENRWQGSNRGSLLDPQVDRLTARLLGAVRADEIRQVNVELHRYMSQNALFVPLYYPPDILIARSGVKGLIGRYSYPAHSWNIYEWEPAG